MSGSGWDSAKAAMAIDDRTNSDILKMELASPGVCLREIRSYLQRITDLRKTTNGAHLLWMMTKNGDTQIDAGPTLYKEPCGDCIHFRSGAELSFGITLRSDGSKSTILAYRFHIQLPNSSGLDFVRIDLNLAKEQYDPLHMPRSHMHPGHEGIHIPFPVMRPLEVLDRIVHVIEPHFTR